MPEVPEIESVRLTDGSIAYNVRYLNIRIACIGFDGAREVCDALTRVAEHVAYIEPVE